MSGDGASRRYQNFRLFDVMHKESDANVAEGAGSDILAIIFSCATCDV
jgi:hypothetical protein